MYPLPQLDWINGAETAHCPIPEMYMWVIMYDIFPAIYALSASDG